MRIRGGPAAGAVVSRWSAAPPLLSRSGNHRYPVLMRYVVSPIAVLLLASCLTGCSPSVEGGAAMDASNGDTVRWPYWPQRMRLHPLTRLAVDAKTGLTVIETRVELFDHEGDTTKGCGQLRVDLHDASDTSGDEPLATWNRDLRLPEVNRQYFDDVTRTYLLRLELEPAELPGRPELRAFFLSADGQRMRAELLLRVQ